jgi:hypothetical protein
MSFVDLGGRAGVVRVVTMPRGRASVLALRQLQTRWKRVVLRAAVQAAGVHHRDALERQDGGDAPELHADLLDHGRTTNMPGPRRDVHRQALIGRGTRDP